MKVRLLLVVLFSWLMISCTQDEKIDPADQQKQRDDDLLQSYMTDRQIDAQKSAEGFYYEVIQENPDGKVVEDLDIVSVYYRISLLDGKVLEAKLPENSEPLKFQHVKDGLIPEGINFGVGFMRVGEKYKFYLPSYLAFGPFAAPGYMGKNEALVAEVEIVDAHNSDQQFQMEIDSIESFLVNNDMRHYDTFNGGYYKVTHSPGFGARPAINQGVKLKFKRSYLDGTLTREGTIEDLLGRNMTDGFTLGVRNMLKGEVASIFVPSSLAFQPYLDPSSGTAGLQIFPQKFRDDFIRDMFDLQNIYPFAIIRYDIELVDVY